MMTLHPRKRTKRSRGDKGQRQGQQPEIPPIPNFPHSLGNAHPTSTSLTGRLEARPHNARPTWCGFETEADSGTRKIALHRGAGHDFVPVERHGGVSRPAQGPCRAPPGRAMKSALSATKQAAGAPSAGSQPFQFTTDATPPMGRRRAAEGGPEGRCRENREPAIRRISRGTDRGGRRIDGIAALTGVFSQQECHGEQSNRAPLPRKPTNVV